MCVLLGITRENKHVNNVVLFNHSGIEMFHSFSWKIQKKTKLKIIWRELKFWDEKKRHQRDTHTHKTHKPRKVHQQHSAIARPRRHNKSHFLKTWAFVLFEQPLAHVCEPPRGRVLFWHLGKLNLQCRVLWLARTGRRNPSKRSGRWWIEVMSLSLRSLVFLISSSSSGLRSNFLGWSRRQNRTHRLSSPTWPISCSQETLPRRRTGRRRSCRSPFPAFPRRRCRTTRPKQRLRAEDCLHPESLRRPIRQNGPLRGRPYQSGLPTSANERPQQKSTTSPSGRPNIFTRVNISHALKIICQSFLLWARSPVL